MADEKDNECDDKLPISKREGDVRRLTVHLDAAQYFADAQHSKDGKNPSVYEGLNLVMKRKAKENNFKPVLQTIRDLMNAADRCVSVSRSLRLLCVLSSLSLVSLSLSLSLCPQWPTVTGGALRPPWGVGLCRQGVDWSMPDARQCQQLSLLSCDLPVVF